MMVRPMKDDDSRDVAVLCAQLGYPSSEDQVRSRLNSLTGHRDQGLFVAEAPDGKVVGWVHVLGMRLLESDPFAEIGGLVVDQDHRGQGFGQALLGEAERWASKKGFADVRLRSNVIRAEAHQFYLKQRYQVVKTQHAFHKSLIDRV